MNIFGPLWKIPPRLEPEPPTPILGDVGAAATMES